MLGEKCFVLITVEPPIKDPLKSLSTMDTFLCTKLVIVMFFSLRKRTASLQRTKCLPPKCPLFRGSTVLLLKGMPHCFTVAAWVAVMIAWHACMHC